MPAPTPEPASLAWIGLGANLGDRRASLDAALAALDALPGVRVDAVSSYRETEPVGVLDQPPFLNAAARVATTLDARALLDAMHAIERAAGRDRARERRWGPRTLDLDLLVFAEAVIDEPGLAVPHPRLGQRRFVLEPLAEIDPDFTPPGSDRSILDLLRALDEHGAPA